MIAVGNTLKAINSCVMLRNGEESLKVGKVYEIIQIAENEGEDCVVVIDEQNEEHYFPISEIKTWFETI